MEAKEDEWLTTNRTTPVSCYPAADLHATPGLWVAARQEEPHPLLATQRSPQPRMAAPRLRATLLNGWFAFTMRRPDSPIDPRKPVSMLVIDGPFRYTRNPAYLSMTMIYAGVAALRNALWATLFLPLVCT